MKTKLNRQPEDYILTDLLPVEKGNYFTNVYFYEYIVKKEILHNQSISPENIINSHSHSIPLKFKTKNGDGFREISIVNPYGLVEAIYFIKFYGDEVINIINYRNNFGQRIPKKNKNALYKRNNKQTVYYQTQEEKEQLLINLEGSGSFYNHYPHKRLDKYLNSYRHSFLKDKFDSILHFDIENYFGSIYTHSYTWLIAKNNLDAIKLNRTNSLFAKIDQLLQNLNGSKTNGIIIGPELSRTLAEFLIIFIDKRVINNLHKENIVRSKDYEIARFVDDFYLYTNDKNTREKIYEVYKDILNDFHLKLKEAKTELIQSDEDVKGWYDPTKQFIDFILEEVINTKENIDDSNINDTIQSDKQDKKRKKITYSSLKSMIDQIILNHGEARTVASYILSTILSTLEKNDDRTDKVKINSLNFINFLFYLVLFIQAILQFKN